MTNDHLPVPIDQLGDLVDAAQLRDQIKEAQANMLKSHTPPECVKTRKIPGGKMAPYIEQSWVNRQLNLAFGWQWSFQVLREQIGQEQLWVLGRLTIHVEPHDIVKEQFGRSEIKRYSSTHPQAGKIMDIKVLDHIILGRDGTDRKGFLSMREEGLCSFE